MLLTSTIVCSTEYIRVTSGNLLQVQAISNSIAPVHMRGFTALDHVLRNDKPPPAMIQPCPGVEQLGNVLHVRLVMQKVTRP